MVGLLIELLLGGLRWLLLMIAAADNENIVGLDVVVVAVP